MEGTVTMMSATDPDYEADDVVYQPSQRILRKRRSSELEVESGIDEYLRDLLKGKKDIVLKKLEGVKRKFEEKDSELTRVAEKLAKAQNELKEFRANTFEKHPEIQERSSDFLTGALNEYGDEDPADFDWNAYMQRYIFMQRLLLKVDIDELQRYKEDNRKLDEWHTEEGKLRLNRERVEDEHYNIKIEVEQLKEAVQKYEAELKQVNEGLNLMESMYRSLQCTLCLQLFGTNERQRVSTKCGHTCCQECATKWFASHRNCPTCKGPGKSFHAVYI